MTSRVQGEDESTADYLTCLQGLYQKFAIRRHEFEDHDQLTTLATDVVRMLETLKVESVPARQEESFFSEFSYSGKTRPRPFISSKEKLNQEIDPTASRLIQSVSEIIRKLDDLKSCPERTHEGNQLGNNRMGSNRSYRQLNKKNNLALPSRGTAAARQGGRTPVLERTSKAEPPCFNCGENDHELRQCPTPWVRFCHICGKHDRIK